MEQPPKTPTTKGSLDHFEGDVFIDGVATSEGVEPLRVGFVHFSPGARTAWHRHGVGQTLYVTDGVGRVQTRGGVVVTLRAGDVVRSARHEWHWHGAAPEHLMTHLAVTEGETEWGAHVDDEE